jgi:predicted TPR repeat methyltransferase
MHKPLENFHDELQQLLTKACADHQNGHLETAGQSYLKLLDYFAEAPILHYNLGLVYYGQGEYVKAGDSFAKAVELQPGDADMLFNLALSLKKTGDLTGAVENYKKVLLIDPACIDALYNLAGCYKDTSQYPEAKATYQEVLRLAPQHQSANSNLAFLYHLDGNVEQAVRHYRQVLEYNPNHQSALHMVAALTGVPATSSPDPYVREVFDNYSEYFERSLVAELLYCVPNDLRALFDRTCPGRKKFGQGLDLGCGTGLGGQAFIDTVEVFDGLDLSPNMLAQASRKGIYRSLHQGSILNFFKNAQDTFDFFLAADVFAYTGDLQETFSLLRLCARPDAIFCFSTESDVGHAYKLLKTGRFAHSPRYIGKIAQETGWRVEAGQETGLRKEQGVWVKGDLWLLRTA